MTSVLHEMNMRKKPKKKHNEYVKKISMQNFTAVRGDKGTPLF